MVHGMYMIKSIYLPPVLIRVLYNKRIMLLITDVIHYAMTVRKKIVSIVFVFKCSFVVPICAFHGVGTDV